MTLRRASRAARRAACAAALVAATTASKGAFAQDHDPAAATELFEKGRTAMKQRDYAKACADFADSQRLDSKVGTLLNLADCEERIGHIVSARAHWQQAADLAHAEGDAREAVAMKRFVALDPRVAKLALRLAGDAPPGAIVRRDNVELGAGSLGVGLPVDPGVHEVVVSAPGYDDSTLHVTLKEGEAQEFVVSPGPQHPTSTVAPSPPPPAAAPPRAEGSSSSLPVQKTLALTAAGAGVVALVVGTVFGLEARSANDSSMSNGSTAGCSPDNACGSVGLGRRDDALRDGNLSTVAFVAGGGLVALGAVLWLTAPKSSAPRAGAVGGLRIVARLTGAELQGAW
jgi:tetratricopeptide (TPR) repeat protein